MLGKTIQSSKIQAPCYTVTGRSKIGSFHEDLQKVFIINIYYRYNYKKLYIYILKILKLDSWTRKL